METTAGQAGVAIELAFPNAETLVITRDFEDSVQLMDANDSFVPDVRQLHLHVGRDVDGRLRLRVSYDGGSQQQQQQPLPLINLKQQQQQHQQQQQQYRPQQKPKNALSELIATERVYVRRLSLLFDHLYRGLHAAAQKRRFSCCTSDELKSVFGHFESMKVMHEQLLAELNEAETAAGGNCDNWRLGPLMTNYGHQLKSYSGYYSAFRLHTATVSRWLKDEAFKGACKQLQNEWPDKSDAKLDVTAHMLEPIQRPLRYPLLLRQYISEIGDEHPDRSDAELALKVIQNTTIGFEKSVKDFNNFHERLMLLRSVNFSSSLTSYWEKLVLHCLLHCQARNVTDGKDSACYLWLCSSALLICKTGRFKLSSWTASTAIELTKDVRFDINGRHLRAQTSRKTWEFVLPTDAESNAWADQLTRLQVIRQEAGRAQDFHLLPWETGAANCEQLQQQQSQQPPQQQQQQQQQHRNKCEGCGTGLSAIAQMMSRKTCRLCSGFFCNDCLAYQQQQRRCCLFCKAAVDDAAVTNRRHRDLLRLFRSARAADANGAAGQLLAMAEWPDAPDWLTAGWTSAWCRVTPDGLTICRQRRQFLPAALLKSPRLLEVGTNGEVEKEREVGEVEEEKKEEEERKEEEEEEDEEVELQIVDSSGRLCRLKGNSDATMRLVAALRMSGSSTDVSQPEVAPEVPPEMAPEMAPEVPPEVPPEMAPEVEKRVEMDEESECGCSADSVGLVGCSNEKLPDAQSNGGVSDGESEEVVHTATL